VYNAFCMEDTNKKIDELAALVKVGFDHVSEEFASVRSEISSVRTELKNEISGIRTDLTSEISSLRTEVHESFARVDEQLLTTNDKVDLIAEKLSDKKVITKEEAKEVMSLGQLPLS
jgi:ATP-dependent Zn protease